MRTPTVLLTLAGAGLAGALALGAAVPALASSATSPDATATSATAGTPDEREPLTGEELARLDQFFSDHPVLGHRLLARITLWQDFLAAHPAFAAELERVRALPADERRGEVRAWLAENPQVRADLRELRADRREARNDLRELIRDLRRAPGSAPAG